VILYSVQIFSQKSNDWRNFRSFDDLTRAKSALGVSQRQGRVCRLVKLSGKCEVLQ
jgi:hypothetical protein